MYFKTKIVQNKRLCELMMNRFCSSMPGEWWEKDLPQVDRNMTNGYFDDYSSGSTINGKLGDLFNCSGNDQFLLSYILPHPVF